MHLLIYGIKIIQLNIPETLEVKYIYFFTQQKIIKSSRPCWRGWREVGVVGHSHFSCELARGLGTTIWKWDGIFTRSAWHLTHSGLVIPQSVEILMPKEAYACRDWVRRTYSWSILLLLRFRDMDQRTGSIFRTRLSTWFKTRRCSLLNSVNVSLGSWVLWALATSPRATTTTAWTGRQNPRHPSSPEAWAQSETGAETQGHRPDLEHHQDQPQVRPRGKLSPLPLPREP